MQFVRHSILVDTAIVVAFLTLIATAVTGTAGYYLARTVIEERVFARLEAVGSDRHEMALMYVTQQQERAKLVASRTRLRSVVAEFHAGKMSREDMEAETHPILLDAQQSTEGFTAIWVVDTSGNVLSASHPERQLSSISDGLLSIAAEQPVLSAPTPKADGISSLLLTPAETQEGQLVGIVVVDVDVKRLASILNVPNLGETGQITVGRFEGDNIRFLFKPGNATDNLAEPKDVPAMVAAIDGQSQTTVSNYFGVEALTYFRPISLQPQAYAKWGLVVSMDSAEAWMPLAGFRRRGWFILVLVGLMGIAGSLFLARRLTRPLRRLTTLATEVANGKLDVQLPVASQDEVGQLGHAFNLMTRALRQSYRTLQERNVSLEQLNGLLQKNNEELGQIVYTMSHDLKSPLVTTRGFLDILREELENAADPDIAEDSEIADAIARIDRATLHMGCLIDQLLELSRAGSSVQEKDWVNIEEVVEDFADAMQSTPGFEGRSIRVEGTLSPLYANRTRIQQVFDNLLSNSLKYGTTDEQPVVTVVGGESADEIRYTFIDHGPGIPEEFRKRIFLPFERLSSDNNGTGIGLAIVAKIVERKGGRIEVVETDGGGATFVLTFPKTA